MKEKNLAKFHLPAPLATYFDHGKLRRNWERLGAEVSESDPLLLDLASPLISLENLAKFPYLLNLSSPQSSAQSLPQCLSTQGQTPFAESLLSLN